MKVGVWPRGRVWRDAASSVSRGDQGRPPATCGETTDGARCPRCIARARLAVKLFSSPLPAIELHGEGSAPQSEQRGGSQSYLARSPRGASWPSIRDSR